MISKQQALYNLLKLGCGPAKPFDIALINETWLRKETVNKVSLPGYEVISKERIGKKEGGICAIVSNKLKHRQRHDLMIDSNKLEHLVIEIKTRWSSIIMVSAYHPPYVNAKEFINDYNKEAIWLYAELLSGITITDSHDKIYTTSGLFFPIQPNV